jgi:hypothetical protein
VQMNGLTVGSSDQIMYLFFYHKTTGSLPKEKR